MKRTLFFLGLLAMGTTEVCTIYLLLSGKAQLNDGNNGDVRAAALDLNDNVKLVLDKIVGGYGTVSPTPAIVGPFSDGTRDFEPRPYPISITFTTGGTCATIRLLASLAGEKIIGLLMSRRSQVITNWNNARSNGWVPDDTNVPNITGFSFETTANVGIPLFGINGISYSTDAKVKILVDAALNFAATRLNIGLNRLSAKYRRASVGRRLLADNMDIYTTSTGPLAQIAQNAAGSSAFLSDFAAAMVLADSTQTAAALTVATIAAVAPGAYTPPEYKVTPAIKAMHGFPRIGASAELPLSASIDMPKVTAYAIGAAIGPGIFVLLLVYIVAMFPCCYCCCCLQKCCRLCCGPKKKDWKPVNKLNCNFAVSIVCLVMAVVTIIVGLAASTALTATLASTADAAQQIVNLISSITTNLSSLQTSSTEAAARLTDSFAGCPPADQFKAVAQALSSATSGINVPAFSIPGVDQLSGPMANYVKLGSLVPFLLLALCILLWSGCSICMNFNKVKGRNKLLNCFHCLFLFQLPLKAIFCIIGLVCILFSLVFGDFCAEDPLKGIQPGGQFASLLGSGGMVTYFLTCKGDPGPDIAKVFAGDIPAAKGAVEALTNLIANDQNSTCRGTGNGGYNETAAAGLAKTKLIAMFDSVINIQGMVSCAPYNKLLTTILYDSVCYNLETSFYNLWIGFFIGVLFLLVAQLNFNKVKRVHGFYKDKVKVAPSGPNDSSEAKPWQQAEQPAPGDTAPPQDPHFVIHPQGSIN